MSLKKNFCLSIFFLACFYSNAQNKCQHPKNDRPFLDVFATAEKYLATDTLKAALHIQTLDSLCNVHQREYPLYVSMIRLWQSWYQLASNKLPIECKQKADEYLSFALQGMRGNERMMLDSFSLNMANIGKSFRDIDQLPLLKPIDELWRKGTGINFKGKLGDYSITLYAWSTNMKGETTVANNLIQYDELYYKSIDADSDKWDQMGLLVNKAISLDYLYKKWEKDKVSSTGVELYSGYRKWSYKCQTWLYKPLIKKNRPNTPNFSYNERNSYFALCQKLMMGYAEFARRYNKVGSVSFDLNVYVKQALMPEIDSCISWKRELPDYLTRNLAEASLQLAEIYYEIGEYNRGLGTLKSAKRKLDKTPYWKDSLAKAYNFTVPYYLTTAKMYYANGDIRLADLSIKVAKAYYPKPPERGERYNNWWENYILARVYEIDGLLSSKRPNEAIDSMLNYYGIIYNNDSASYPGKKYESLFLHHVSKMLIAREKWQMAMGFSSDALRFLDHSSSFDLTFFHSILAANILANIKSNSLFLKKEALQTLLNYTFDQLNKNLLSLSPDQRIIFYENKLLPFFDLYHSLVFEGILNKHPELREQIAMQSINLKNLLSSNDESLLKNTTGTNYFEIANELLGLKKDIIRMENESLLSRKEDETIDIQKDQIESMYATILNDKDFTVNFYTAADIAQKLSPTDAYAEFIRYNNLLRKDTISYGAFVVSKTNQQFLPVKLFHENQLIRILNDKNASFQLRALKIPGQRSVSIKSKPANNDSTQQKATPITKDKLAAIIFDSLNVHLKNKSRLIFIPDGYLNRISFAALKMNNQFLFQQYSLKQLSAVKMLFEKTKTIDTIKWMVAGGLQYDEENCIATGKFLADDVSWNYLPGTLKEVQLLQEKFTNKVSLLKVVTGNSFTDSSLASFSKYPYIHIASHGFYFDSSEVDSYFSDRYMHSNIKRFPLLRTGIVVSNANCPIEKNLLSKNGYLSGYEIAATDLSSCKLIVLSACESALGDIKSNLGVMGLQRAIKLAGAQKMLITLWKIPDAETVEFMQQFYTFLWGGKTEEESLKATQEIQSKKYDVGKWGAFVLIE